MAAVAAALMLVGPVGAKPSGPVGQFVKPCKKVSAKVFNRYLRKRQSLTGSAQRFERRRVCLRRLMDVKRSIKKAERRIKSMQGGLASWYGPGFYGNRTACGQTYTTTIIGVAHKTLPCGTRVWVRYNGRTVEARVIDRGPYSGARVWDLSAALANRLGFSGVQWIRWTLRPCC